MHRLPLKESISNPRIKIEKYEHTCKVEDLNLDEYIPPQTTLKAELHSIHVHIGLRLAQKKFIYFQSKFFCILLKVLGFLLEIFQHTCLKIYAIYVV